MEAERDAARQFGLQCARHDGAGAAEAVALALEGGGRRAARSPALALHLRGALGYWAGGQITSSEALEEQGSASRSALGARAARGSGRAPGARADERLQVA